MTDVSGRPSTVLKYGLIVVLLAGVFGGSWRNPVASAEPIVHETDNARVFPVSRYPERDVNQTGNNNYYAMARNPGTDLVAVGSSGAEDLLLYQDNHFTINRMDPLIYHRDVTWRDSERLLMAASRTPPDTGGVIMEFNRSTGRFDFVVKTPNNIQSLDLVGNEILAVGGDRFPEQEGVIYSVEDGDYAERPSPDGIVLHAVDWNPRIDRALIGGENGVLLEWDSDTYSRIDVPGGPLIKSVAWHPRKNKALLGGDRGRIYQYEDGQVRRIATEFDWTIHDIAWHPTEDYALIVGGVGAQDRGYWARFEDVGVTSHSLSKPFFSVEWIDEKNALFGGQRPLWRYSTNVDPSELGLEASLSTSHRRAGVSEPLTLSGFGSTYKANADSVARYLFKYDTGDSSGWQKSPDNTMQYHRSGIYHPTLVVEGPDGTERATDSLTVRVGDVDTRTWLGLLTSTWFLIPLGVVLLGAGLFYRSRS